MLKLGNKLRQLRKEKNMTQEELADVLDVTVGAVYKWESNQSNPSLELIVKLAEFFDLSTDVILNHQLQDRKLSKVIEKIKE